MKKTAIVCLVFVSIVAFLYRVGLIHLYDFSGLSRTVSQKPLPKGNLIIKAGLLADSHVDYQRLEKAIYKAKDAHVDFLFHFGDLSDFGGFSELTKSRAILDKSNIPYYVLPGDRDVVESGINFNKIFSDKVCTDQLLKYKIGCLKNPYNYTLIEDGDLRSFYSLLSSSNIIFTSQPIYNPRSNVYMGFYNKLVKTQADEIYSKVFNSNKVGYVFSGDAHFFSKYNDSKIDYYNLGAITDKKNLQNPNFTILEVYENTVEAYQVNID